MSPSNQRRAAFCVAMNWDKKQKSKPQGKLQREKQKTDGATSTQSSGLGTSGTTKLQSGRVFDASDLIPDQITFGTQQALGHGFSSLSEAAHDNLQVVQVAQKTALLDLLEDEGGELVGGVVGAATGLLESNVAGGQGHQDIDLLAGIRVLPRSLSQGEVGVVLGRKNV